MWLNIVLFNSTILLLDIYPRGMEMCPHKNLSMNIHSSVLAKKYNSWTNFYVDTFSYLLGIYLAVECLKCLSADESVSKMWYILSMTYCCCFSPFVSDSS